MTTNRRKCLDRDPQPAPEYAETVIAAFAAFALAAAPSPASPACASLRPTDAVAYAATARHPLRAYRRAGAGPLASFRRLNVNGVPTVFGVLDAQTDSTCRATWLRVRLPMRPNGVTGWVRARDVRLTKVTARVVVDLSAREVTLYVEGAAAFRTRAAIGSPATPTPLGSYYVNQKLVPDDPRGPYGAGAIGISAFSPVLKNWPQGGPVAIHGTNQPSLLGRPISNGCVRVANAAIRRLWRAAPPGTPVLIQR
jgi:lipoprotein-anchoring transpeptidase ErfK/SrfK